MMNDSIRVTLNVYTCAKRRNPTANHLSAVLGTLGLGIHHSGLEIGDWGELTYNKQGIVRGPAKYVPGWEYYRSEFLGMYDGSTGDVDRILKWLRDKAGYRRGAYDLLRRNCNHFTHALAAVLVGTTHFPSYVNRPAEVASSTFGLSGSMLEDDTDELVLVHHVSSSTNKNEGMSFYENDVESRERATALAFVDTDNKKRNQSIPSKWRPSKDTSVVILVPPDWLGNERSNSFDSEDETLPQLSGCHVPYPYVSSRIKMSSSSFRNGIEESTIGWSTRIGQYSECTASAHQKRQNFIKDPFDMSFSLLQAARETAAAHNLPQRALMTKQLVSNAALLGTVLPALKHDKSTAPWEDDDFIVSAEPPPPPPRQIIKNNFSPEHMFSFLVCGFCQVEPPPQTQANITIPRRDFHLEQAIANQPDFIRPNINSRSKRDEDRAFFVEEKIPLHSD